MRSAWSVRSERVVAGGDATPSSRSRITRHKSSDIGLCPAQQRRERTAYSSKGVALEVVPQKFEAMDLH